jgi:hypothetical protein
MPEMSTPKGVNVETIKVAGVREEWFACRRGWLAYGRAGVGEGVAGAGGGAGASGCGRRTRVLEWALVREEGAGEG